MFNATVVSRKNVTDDLIIIRIKPDSGIGSFHSGQYVAIGLPGEAPRPDHFPPETEIHPAGKLIKRAYSIGSAPHDTEALEFYIALLPTGALTSRLALIKEGDRIYCAPKITGTFTLHDVPPDHNLILVATGTGLAPYISMLRTAETWTPERKIYVLHGVRKRSDLGYREELLEFTKRDNFLYVPFVSREEGEGGIRKGYVQSIISSGELVCNPQKDHIFVCGNPAMIDEIEKLSLSKGYAVHSKKTPEGSLHLEKYW